MATTRVIFAASATSINETELRLRLEENNRADWRSTLRYARVTQCTPNCDINRSRAPPGPFVFDTIEISASNMEAGERDPLRQKVNQIFELHDCPWRISDGEFFKLDADFVVRSWRPRRMTDWQPTNSPGRATSMPKRASIKAQVT